MRRLVAIALCIAGLVALTGPAAGAAEELTKAEFIAAADKLCTDTDQFLFFVTLSLSEPDQTGPPSDAQLEEFAPYLASSYRDLIGEIRKLEEPKADRAAIKKLLKTLSKEIAAIEDDPLSLRDGDVLPRFSKLSKRYGFTACGANG